MCRTDWSAHPLEQDTWLDSLCRCLKNIIYVLQVPAHLDIAAGGENAGAGLLAGEGGKARTCPAASPGARLGWLCRHLLRTGKAAEKPAVETGGGSCLRRHGYILILKMLIFIHRKEGFVLLSFSFSLGSVSPSQMVV